MGLTGIDQNDPTPAHRRELKQAQGVSAGGAPENKVILYGNKTAAGSETVDTLGSVILSDEDAEARMGTRSELLAMYRKFVEVDSGAQMYFVAVTESGGLAAEADFTFAGTATEVGTIDIHCHGEDFQVSVSEGDTAATVAAAVDARIPNAAEGSLQVTSSILSAVVTVAYIHNGPRGGLVIGNGTNVGVRMISNVAGITVTKGALTAGTVDDDGAAAFAAASAGEFAFHVLPWHATAAVTSSDGQIGEALAGVDGVKTAYLPINGKEQTIHVGLVGTQAQATAVATSSPANSVLAYFYRAENNDWSPAMLAAHHAAVSRSLVVAHPAMPGAVRYTSTDSSVYNVRDPFDPDDRPTAAEIRADLDNGVTPVQFDTNGRASIPRIITSRSLNAAGDNDYRAREGHITYVVAYFWERVEQRYSELLQPFIAGDLKEGQRPYPLTTTPSNVTDLIQAVIRDLASRTPSGGLVGPVLAPDREQEMLDSVKVKKGTASFTAQCQIFAVEHLIKSETTVRETSAAY
jgi:phage tail sheath gpL-like